MTAALHLLPRTQYVSMPWRNGSGVTQEIARHPAAPGDFLWRLSLATVSHSGPFSKYPGYQRSVTLIDGAGFALDIDGQPATQLRLPGQSAHFPGDAATRCTLFDGPCTDLSLMVLAPGAIVSVSAQACDVPRAFHLQPAAMQAFFCLAGTVLLSAQDTHLQLTPLDTALADGSNSSSRILAQQSAACVLLRLVWRVNNC